MEQALLVHTTFADETSARQCADHLLEQKLVACAVFNPHVQSVFRWNGMVQMASETAVLFKTLSHLKESVMQNIRNHHTYETLVILAWNVEADEATLNWLKAETTQS